MSSDARRLRRGMKVLNPDGHRLGRVGGVHGDHFHVKRGWLLPDEFIARNIDVKDVEGDEVVLQMRGTLRGELNEGRHSGSRGKDVAARTGDERLL